MRRKKQLNEEFASFLSKARIGDVAKSELDKVNKRALATGSYQKISQETHMDTIWISPFKEVVKEKNILCLNRLIDEQKYHYRFVISSYFYRPDHLIAFMFLYRCIATHGRCTANAPLLTQAGLQNLFKYDPKRFGQTAVHLAIGSRVKCTTNLAQEIGVYAYNYR